jgi:arginase
MNKRIVRPIIIPLHFGANAKGIELGADFVKENLENYILLPEVEIKDQHQDDSLKNLSTVVATNQLLSTAISSIYQAGEFPLVIGGDHSVALGSISAVATLEEDLGVIWVDAHGDFNTAKTSESGNIHGMILAALVGMGEESLVKLHVDQVKIKKENVVIFGVRDLDEGEKALLDRLEVKYLPYSYIIKIGLVNALQEVVDYLSPRIKQLHISIDLDSLDPKIIPGVSVPVSNGFKKDDVITIVKALFTNFTISSSDIVEYNPLLDSEDKTLNFLLLLVELFKKLV